MDSVEFELAGIARPWALDRAAEAMRASGAVGGMVRLGDDCLVFGRPGNQKAWRITVPNPFWGEAPVAILEIRDGAVCTRNNWAKSYASPASSTQRRIGHIVDPRTGRQAAENVVGGDR